MMAIEFVRQFPLASGVIFEQPGVADVPEEFGICHGDGSFEYLSSSLIYIV
ncbi:hypothetical protein [Pelosinus baikalensis]|uniref:Uncharacterized protein n=1 Tax=Pelosinus baikalensis TaxID=2892015 RepID=A0ABS8HUF7_9FIRM|nr:hypothetical protein [Pelosinus baikalensis]MCC5466798.1 hypothetical protein [Pelosinus baikalensis]